LYRGLRSIQPLPRASSQPKRFTRNAPNTATPLLLSSAAPTAVPSSRAVARCAWHCASISSLPMTVTLERKQYQPCGFASLIVLRPITFTAGRTSTSRGFAVTVSSPEDEEPMPNTFTPVEITPCGAVPLRNGDDFPQ